VRVYSTVPEIQVRGKRKDTFKLLRFSVFQNPFVNKLINTTPLPLLDQYFLSPLTYHIDFLNPYTLHRKALLAAYDRLLDHRHNGNERPAFVFAHILAPHPPFVFGPNGEATGEHLTKVFTIGDGSQFIKLGGRVKDYKKGYIDLIQYVNKKTMETVDRILNESDRASIIILQGDHGPRISVDWGEPDKADFEEVFPILNAYYLPEGGKKHLYSDISPINTFRVIFNHTFGTDYEILEDRSYYSVYNYPYQFIDVTEEVKK